MRLVFLGNYAVNGVRREQEQIAEYNELAEKLARLQYDAAFGIPGEETEKNELTDLRDRVYDDARLFLEAFEEDVYREISAEKKAPPVCVTGGVKFVRIFFTFFRHTLIDKSPVEEYNISVKSY